MMPREGAVTVSSFSCSEAEIGDGVPGAPLLVLVDPQQPREGGSYHSPPQPHTPSSDGSGRDCVRGPKSSFHLLIWAVDVH